MDIETKIKKLEDKMADGREDSLAEIVAMKKTLKNAMLKKNLKQHPALLQLLGVLRKREASYTTILANKEDMDEVTRQAYFQRRKEVRFMLSFFDSADKTIKGLNAELDYQLSDEVAEESVDS